MSKKLSLCLIAAASVAATACTIDVQGEEAVLRDQKRLQVTGTPNLTVRTFDGTLEFRSWDQPEIVIDIERRAATEADARDIRIDVTDNDGDILIEAKHPNRRGFLEHMGPSPRVRMIVAVPRQLNLEARTGDGAIMARDLDGRIELSTGDGSVRLQGIRGRMTIRTGDGAITASELQGSVTVSTGDGSVMLSGRLDDLSARTGDGAIDVNVLPGSTMRGDWNVSTGDGGVKILLPPDFNADIQATTGDGGIATTGVTLASSSRPDDQERQRERRRRELRGRVGSGGEMLTVRTGDGSVDIHVR
jgi:hypothetical protein